jgi:hypothetical protein
MQLIKIRSNFSLTIPGLIFYETFYAACRVMILKPENGPMDCKNTFRSEMPFMAPTGMQKIAIAGAV